MDFSQSQAKTRHYEYLIHQREVIFQKFFLYNKDYNKPGSWVLPNADELFKECYQFETLQHLKNTLNKVKSKLNNYDTQVWSLHTRRQEVAGEIPRRMNTEINAEFVTVAWCKLYECLGRFPGLVKGPEINSLHLCEAPGAFITALNHYLYSKYDRKVQWKWLATTLNPYYEGNPVQMMIMDDRFLLHTLDNWLFHKDFTGNIINTENLLHMQKQCEKRLGEVNLITADGSIDCIDSFECQEEKVALLHYAEIITALTILSDGGSFLLKMFTMYEASSVSKLFLLNCVFENVHVFKPCTSKCGNSEVYVICLNYKKQTTNLSEILEKMKLKLNPHNSMIWPLFAESTFPDDFLKQHEICCRMFMNYQINVIEKNISTYNMRPNKSISQHLWTLKSEVWNEFCTRFNIRKLPDGFKILQNTTTSIEKGFKIYIGSHSDREMLKETSRENKISKYHAHLNELDKMIKTSIDIKCVFEWLNENEKVKLNLYRGQCVVTLNSSMFVDVNLLIMRSKLNELFTDAIDESLWLQHPRFEYNSNDSLHSINFTDFATACNNFSLQQENFFSKVISMLLATKPNEIKFINMPFLSHYAVSILRYFSYLPYSKLSFSLEPKFEIILTSCTSNFTTSLTELQTALNSSIEQDILCFLDILELHHNDFHKTLRKFNNVLLLHNLKYSLNNRN